MTIAQAFQVALQHHQAGRLAEAEALFRQILAVEPRHADALHHLGIVAHQAGKGDEAVEWIRKAIAVVPDAPILHANLGEILRQQGRTREAIACCERATRLSPDYADAHYNMGNAFLAEGRFDEAAECFRRTVRLAPGFVRAHNNLGVVLAKLGFYEEAAGAFRQAAERMPDYAEAHDNLGCALTAVGRLDEAAAACRRALQINPGMHGAHNNLGIALKAQGRIEEAVGEFRRALQLQPDYFPAHGNLLQTLHYSPGCDAQSLFAEHRRWGEVWAQPLAGCLSSHGNDRDPERRLRVGYVSADFREHSVAFFIEGLLAAHDREKAEVFCYADLAREDAVSARLRGHVAHWRRITGMNDAQVAELIRGDGIDLLVDLAGHTDGSRLLVFARKPAPVQVTYLGYPDTTGMTAMDWRLTDGHADPPGTGEDLHSEALVRLPDCAWCYRPPEEAPAVGSLPALRAGHVTFGSFHVMAKITAEMLVLWARLLVKVPGSRLILKNEAFGESAVRERVLGIFRQEGIVPERVEMIGWIHKLAGHLGAFGAVDIALDTYPYHGTTTTCEALWMGVPVVTRAGRTHVSRVGVSLLKNAGLPELIAADADEYVEIAAKLAGDIPRLSALRATLRGRMSGGVLTDGARFARNVEEAYRKMWRAWCGGEKTRTDA